MIPLLACCRLEAASAKPQATDSSSCVTWNMATSSSREEEYDDARYDYDHLTSSLPIPGLFHDFALPAKLF